MVGMAGMMEVVGTVTWMVRVVGMMEMVGVIGMVE